MSIFNFSIYLSKVEVSGCCKSNISFLSTRSKCSSFFDINCHIKYICVSWMVLFGLLLAIFPTGIFHHFSCHSAITVIQPCQKFDNGLYAFAAIVLLWLLHQKGFFDSFYDWSDDRFGDGNQIIRSYSMHGKHTRQSHIRHYEEDGRHVHHKDRLHPSHAQKRRKSSQSHCLLQQHGHPEWAVNDHYHLKHDSHRHVHKERHKHKHKHNKDSLNSQQSHKVSRNGPTSRVEVPRDKVTKHHEDKMVRKKHVHGTVHGQHLHSEQHDKDIWNLM